MPEKATHPPREGGNKNEHLLVRRAEEVQSAREEPEEAGPGNRGWETVPRLAWGHSEPHP